MSRIPRRRRRFGLREVSEFHEKYSKSLALYARQKQMALQMFIQMNQSRAAFRE